MQTHATVQGTFIEYEPTPSVAALLERLSGMLADPAATVADMVAATYCPANPLLDAEMMPPYGMVTKATLADPAYRVMTDLLNRKQVAPR